MSILLVRNAWMIWRTPTQEGMKVEMPRNAQSTNFVHTPVVRFVRSVRSVRFFSFVRFYKMLLVTLLIMLLSFAVCGCGDGGAGSGAGNGVGNSSGSGAGSDSSISGGALDGQEESNTGSSFSNNYNSAANSDSNTNPGSNSNSDSNTNPVSGTSSDSGSNSDSYSNTNPLSGTSSDSGSNSNSDSAPGSTGSTGFNLIHAQIPGQSNLIGQLRSDLTGEWIDAEAATTRPLAVMIPDNPSALPQYNVSKASVIYECVVESDVCRFLCLFDDWRDLDRIGNVRSARAYYVYWALEWDPIFFHCGNVYYADEILNHPACDNINCVKTNFGWYRVEEEGRIKTQSLYTSTQDVTLAADKLGYQLTHTQYYTRGHFRFADPAYVSDAGEVQGEIHLSALYKDASSSDFTDNPGLDSYCPDSEAADDVCIYPATTVDLSGVYLHDKPQFIYNEATGTYDRYQFGSLHTDAANNDAPLSFKNVILQYCDANMIDLYDHWEYLLMDGGSGYYITNGEAIKITWAKEDTLSPTRYYSLDGTEIVLNPGKTMICIVDSKHIASEAIIFSYSITS